MKSTIFFVILCCLLYGPAQSQDQFLYHLDGTLKNYATSVATSPGEIVVTGYVYEEDREAEALPALPFICKKDHHGNLIWMKTYRLDGTKTLFPKTIIKTSDGGYLIGGNTQLIIPTGNNMFLLKIDSGGHLEWFSLYNCQSLPAEMIRYCDANYLHQVTEISEGGYLISGSQSFDNDPTTAALAIKVDFQGHVQNTTAFQVPGFEENDLLKTYNLANGDYICLIRSIHNSSTDGLIDRAILKRMDQQFNPIWEKTILNEENGQGFYARDFTVDFNGDFIVLGKGINQLNILTKVDGTGHEVWTTTFEKPASYNIFRPKAVTNDWAGNVYFVGFIDIVQGTNPVYVIKTNTHGVIQWAKTYGDNMPYSDAFDIEMVKFPANEITYGDKFVFPGTYVDQNTTSVDNDFWVVTGRTSNGDAACRYQNLPIDAHEGNYRMETISMERIDLDPFAINLEMEENTPEYTRTTCSPFNFPLAGANTGASINQSKSIEKEAKLDLLIFPNPNTGSFAIRSGWHKGKVSIFDPMGRLILEVPFTGNQDFNLGNYPKGVYLISISDDQETIQQKLIID